MLLNDGCNRSPPLNKVVEVLRYCVVCNENVSLARLAFHSPSSELNLKEVGFGS